MRRGEREGNVFLKKLKKSKDWEEKKKVWRSGEKRRRQRRNQKKPKKGFEN